MHGSRTPQKVNMNLPIEKPLQGDSLLFFFSELYFINSGLNSAPKGKL